MPIHEFECESCLERFEELVRTNDQKVICSGCGSDRVKRQLSVFGVGSATSTTTSGPPSSPCSTCGDPAGSCSM